MEKLTPRKILEAPFFLAPPVTSSSIPLFFFPPSFLLVSPAFFLLLSNSFFLSSSASHYYSFSCSPVSQHVISNHYHGQPCSLPCPCSCLKRREGVPPLIQGAAAASSVGKGSSHLSRVLPAPPGGEIAFFSCYKKSLKKLIVFGFLKGGLQRYIGFFVDKSYY